jgi:hypothetical protein
MFTPVNRKVNVAWGSGHAEPDSPFVEKQNGAGGEYKLRIVRVVLATVIVESLVASMKACVIVRGCGSTTFAGSVGVRADAGYATGGWARPRVYAVKLTCTVPPEPISPAWAGEDRSAANPKTAATAAARCSNMIRFPLFTSFTHETGRLIKRNLAAGPIFGRNVPSFGR